MVNLVEKWQGATTQDLASRAGELIEDLRTAKLQINLNVPATPEKATAFFKMFICERCGSCCQTQVGIVLLPGEAERIAGFLKISSKQFKKRYTFTHDGRRYLNHPCPFLDDPPGCRIFSVYPQVCRLWPVNTPVGNGNLYCNSSCPAGRKVVERILKYQAQFG